MIKTSKKVSIVVMALIMIVGTIGFGGLMKVQESTIGQYDYYQDDQEWMQEEIKRTINDMEDEAERLQQELNEIDREADPLAYDSVAEMIAGNQDSIEMYEIA